jgi:hypothetical protein
MWHDPVIINTSLAIGQWPISPCGTDMDRNGCVVPWTKYNRGNLRSKRVYQPYLDACKYSRSSDMVVFLAGTPCSRHLFQHSIFMVTNLGQVDAEVIWRNGCVHHITSDQTQSPWRWRQYVPPKKFVTHNHHPLNNAAKTWKPTLRARAFISTVLCIQHGMTLAQKSCTTVFILHYSVYYILEDTSHHSQVILCCWAPSLWEFHCHYLLFHLELVPPSL